MARKATKKKSPRRSAAKKKGASKKPAAKVVSATQARTKLLEGNKRFVDERPLVQWSDKEDRKKLKDGQSPYAVIITCADSRVPPEMIFNTGMNELFVIRVAGNVANPETIASVEYAIAKLETKLIVVLGHTGCGAVDAAIESGGKPVMSLSLTQLIRYILPATRILTGSKKPTPAERNAVVKRNAEINASAFRLSTIIAGKPDVQIWSAVYDIVAGDVGSWEKQ